MSGDLGVRLRELAERETRGIDVVHPAGLGDSGPRRNRGLLVVAAVVALLAGGLGVTWFVDRDDPGVVEVADAPGVGGSSESLSLPSVLFEEPTSEADLPDRAVDFFQQVTIPGNEDGDVSLVFSALRSVDGPEGSVVVVGIDSTSRFICQTVQTAVGAAMGGGCTPVVSFASRGGMTQTAIGGPDGHLSAGLVADEVVGITVDGVAADIVDNVFFSTSPIDSTPAGTESITLQYADGTSLQGGTTPAGVAATGTHNGRPLSEPFAVGCATFDDGFSARVWIIDDGGLFSVTLDQTSIQVSDSIDRIEATLDTTSNAATITSSDTPAGLIIDATWTSGDSSGEIHIACGRNHVGVRTLPKQEEVSSESRDDIYLAPGEILLNTAPVVVQAASAPEPLFDTSTLGQQVPLSPITDIAALIDQITSTRFNVVSQLAEKDEIEILRITAVGSVAGDMLVALVYLDAVHPDNGPTRWRCRLVTHSQQCGGDLIEDLLDQPGALPDLGNVEPSASYTPDRAGDLIWEPLADDTSVVVFTTAQGSLWQRPVGGLAVFPTDLADGELFELAALDSNGNVLIVQTFNDPANKQTYPQTAPDLTP